MEAAEENITDSLSRSELDSLSKEELSVLLDVSNTLNSTLDFEEILHRVLERLTEVVHAQASSIWLINELSQKLYVASAIGERSKDIKKVQMDIGKGVVGQVVKTGHSRLIPDARREPAHARYIARQVNFEARTMLCVPMFYKNKIIGAIQALNKVNGENFDENDMRRISVFANLSGIAIENARLYGLSQKENIYLRRELGELAGGALRFDDIVGQSVRLKKLKETARRVAQTDSNLLLLGESGTGKGIFARAIHNASRRSRGPFITVNCGAIPEELLESELFGHVKGSFTTAIKDKLGQFELANGGTIFLDEIGDTPLKLQVKLLHAIEDKRFVQVGGIKTIEVNVRVIAATNQNLEEKMAKGEFREDLYYRLSVINISIPPLRERREDIPLLAERFLEKYSREMNRRIKGFSSGAMNILINYDWPGNIRELENTIESTIVFANSEIIQANDLISLHPKIQTKIERDENYSDRMDEAIKQFKKRHITKILNRTNGNRTTAAKKLEIQRTYLSRLIKELNIDA
ncbi:MAG: sigma-54 interaction domain-containing protein [Candidatus Poribacteria bacterium]